MGQFNYFTAWSVTIKTVAFRPRIWNADNQLIWLHQFKEGHEEAYHDPQLSSAYDYGLSFSSFCPLPGLVGNKVVQD